MYVRRARNADEAWLLDELDTLGIHDAGFRSRDYAIAMDPESGDPCGAGRVRYHDNGREVFAELVNLVSFEGYQGPSPIPDLIKELAAMAAEEHDVERLFATDPSEALESLGGEWKQTGEFDVDEILMFSVDEFVESDDDTGDSIEELADEFGYDEDTTTKYNTK